MTVTTTTMTMTMTRTTTTTKAALALMLTAAALACSKPDASVPADAFAHCIYTNKFSHEEECREFRGAGWTQADAQASCDEYSVDVVLGGCPYVSTDGACVEGGGTADKAIQLVIPAGDPGKCADNQRGCELFGGGTWVAGSVCGGKDVPNIDDYYDPNAPYSVPPVQVCVAPLDDVPGQSADGQVCTWQQMSGCTEENRHFSDYASCDDVRTQRPYAPVPANTTQPLADPRLQDAAYAADVAWVKGQLSSCACECCHSAHLAPQGASVWDLDVDGNFVNTFSDWGIAFAARSFDSSLLGSYDAADNNGFSRFIAGLPSNDEARMKAFFERELAHRGLSDADFSDETPAPAVFYQQSIYQPTACANGEGVDDDGVVHWSGGRARYLSILAVGSANPGVPPNLDVPDGTIWKIDTVPPAIPMKTGEVTYGTVPAGTIASFPALGAAPAELEHGVDYYLYAQADVGVPVTRCVFTR